MNNIRDKDGIFRIVGLGSVASMVRQMSEADAGKEYPVKKQDLVDMKVVLISGLGDLYSAISTDLVYSYPAYCREPNNNELVLSVQKRSFDYLSPGQRNWKNELLHDWLEEDSNIWGADAFKVTIYPRTLQSRIIISELRRRKELLCFSEDFSGKGYAGDTH